MERDDLINPYWIDDKELKRGEVDYLGGAEIQFFKELIEKYLRPLDEDGDAKASPLLFLCFSLCIVECPLRYVCHRSYGHH